MRLLRTRDKGMRRIEQDPEEIREEEDAMSRAATPMHVPKGVEQAVDRFAEIENRELLIRLGQIGLRLKNPVEHGYERLPDNEWES